MDTGREAVELEIAEGHTLKRFLKPAIRLIARVLRFVYRVTFSTGSTPLSANVPVIAHKP